MKKQKDAVVELVRHKLPNFMPYKDIALILLSKDQLESIKAEIAHGIMSGTIDYGKTLVRHEVIAYARSMTMNHLKKARELNGNQVYGKSVTDLRQDETARKLASVDLQNLPEELQTYIKGIV